MRLFRDEAKLSKYRLDPLGRSAAAYLLQMTQVKSVVVVYVSIAKQFKAHGAPLFFEREQGVFDERLASLSSHLQKVRVICSEGLKRCFNGFVSPRNRFIPTFDRYQDLVLISHQQR